MQRLKEKENVQANKKRMRQPSTAAAAEIAHVRVREEARAMSSGDSKGVPSSVNGTRLIGSAGLQ